MLIPDAIENLDKQTLIELVFKLKNESNALKEILDSILNNLYKNEPKGELQTDTAYLMSKCLTYWTLSTGKGKIDFALTSGIWETTTDKGYLRVRSLDRYLDPEKVPKKPKLEWVRQSVEFTLSISAKSKTLDKLRIEILKLSERIFEV